MPEFVNFPKQQIAYSKKDEKWRKQCVDWADSKSYWHYEPVRKSIRHKIINYDLVDGKIHMDDLKAWMEADAHQGSQIPKKIPHYPIINSKLDLLYGEEESRIFEHRVVVTNPTAISEMEKTKKAAILDRLQQYLQGNQEQTQSQDDAELDAINNYFTYEYQDIRERNANFLLNHYYKELNMKPMFTEGFRDATTVGEEIYKCDIDHGEPTIRRVNPKHISIFRSGYSNHIEDADIVVTEEYMSPGMICDLYGEQFTAEDLKYIEDLPIAMNTGTSTMGEYEPRNEFINTAFVGDEGTAVGLEDQTIRGIFEGATYNLQAPFDEAGNLRVLKVYWKSRKPIKMVKHFDEITGKETYDYYEESHVIDKSKGEEEKLIWINEAWEGTKIGEKIYVNIGPCKVQYNSLNNPSRCHFGFVGTIYNLNEGKPFSMVDRLKPFAYYYDVIHYRLNELVATSWGKMIRLDMSKKPDDWSVEKWLHFARKSKVLVENPFNVGKTGQASGIIAGSLNTANSGAVDADQTAGINMHLSILQQIDAEMSAAAGISKQREGSIENRETVGGVERATMQSAMITKWLFETHDDTKRRALMVFLETAKEAVSGGLKKFDYILDDGAKETFNIDGEQFCECDYGICIENGDGAQRLNQQIDMIAQAAMQNKMLDMGSILKLYSTSSLSEKQRMVDAAEKRMKAQQQQAAQAEQEAEQKKLQIQLEQIKAQQEFADKINMRDNETKIRVAEIQAGVQEDIANKNLAAKQAEDKPVEGDNGE